MAIGPIPWSSINEYCHEEELGIDGREGMFNMMRAMDRAFLDHERERVKEERETSRNKGKRDDPGRA